MDKMGEEFHRRFADKNITKVLTIEASGIAIACSVARCFNVPLVFAKKSKSVNIEGDMYIAEVESFTHKNKIAQIVLLSRKRKYQRYHFDSINKLEFYRSNRVVFNGGKAKGATSSKLVETNLVGKQTVKWDDSAEIRMIVFDKLPSQITDSVKKENLGVGERICASDICLFDRTAFCQHTVRNIDMCYNNTQN